MTSPSSKCITYKRCAGDTQIPSANISTSYQTSDVPVMAAYQGALYFAYLGPTANIDDSYPLYVGKVTQTGSNYTWASAIQASAYVKAITPCFSVYDEHLYLFSFDTASNLQYQILDDTSFAFGTATTVSTPADTPTAISVASRPDKQWLLVTDDDKNAYVKEFKSTDDWVNLAQTNANVQTSVGVGVTLIPGIPKDTTKPPVTWRVYVVWKDDIVRDTLYHASDDNKPLFECFLEVST